MIEIKNGSIVELDKDNSYKYVVMGYHSNGITVMPLENYKNKIFKDFKYILFFFLAKVKVIDKIKDEDFNTVLIKTKLFVPYLRKLKEIDVKIYDKEETWKLDYENTEVFLIDNFCYCWRKVKSDEDIQKFDKDWTSIISIKR